MQACKASRAVLRSYARRITVSKGDGLELLTDRNYQELNALQVTRSSVNVNRQHEMRWAHAFPKLQSVFICKFRWQHCSNFVNCPSYKACGSAMCTCPEKCITTWWHLAFPVSQSCSWRMPASTNGAWELYYQQLGCNILQSWTSAIMHSKMAISLHLGNCTCQHRQH